MESFDFKDTLRRTKKVDIWFWDGTREYTGEAVGMTPQGITAFLKVSQFGDETVVPTSVIVNGLIKHLTHRVVEFKVQSQGMEAAVKAKVVSLKQDLHNHRRLDLEACFEAPSERNQMILNKLAELFKTPGAPPA